MSAPAACSPPPAALRSCASIFDRSNDPGLWLGVKSLPGRAVCRCPHNPDVTDLIIMPYTMNWLNIHCAPNYRMTTK